MNRRRRHTKTIDEAQKHFPKRPRFRFFFCGGVVWGRLVVRGAKLPADVPSQRYDITKRGGVYTKQKNWVGPGAFHIITLIRFVRRSDENQLDWNTRELTVRGKKYNNNLFLFFQFICLSDIHIHKLFKRERTKKGGNRFCLNHRLRDRMRSLVWGALMADHRWNCHPINYTHPFPPFLSFFRFQQLHPIMHHHHPADGSKRKKKSFLSVFWIFIFLSGAIPKYRYFPVQKRSAYNLFFDLHRPYNVLDSK